MIGKRMKKKEPRPRAGKAVVIALAILILGLGIAVLIMYLINQQPSKAGGQIDTSEDSSDKWNEGTISYHGKQYQYNQYLKTFLFMGIDNDQPVAPAKDGISGGQSDAMFLLVQDSKTKTMSVVALHRNSIAMLDIYDKEGEYLGQQKGQICLQHGYGDGMNVSCQRSAKAVSRLFYNIPIKGYIALNMGGVPAINDAIDGVEVEVLQDLQDQERKVALKQGQNVTLSGNEAYVYLRRRDIGQFDSASDRLKRQQQYILQFFSQAKKKAMSNPLIANDLNEAMKSYMVTNMSVMDILTEVSGYEFTQDRMYSVPGKTVMGGEFEEYHIDDDALYQMVIDVFYNEVKE